MNVVWLSGKRVGFQGTKFCFWILKLPWLYNYNKKETRGLYTSNNWRLIDIVVSKIKENKTEKSKILHSSIRPPKVCQYDLLRHTTTHTNSQVSWGWPTQTNLISFGVDDKGLFSGDDRRLLYEHVLMSLEDWHHFEYGRWPEHNERGNGMRVS